MRPESDRPPALEPAHCLSLGSVLDSGPPSRGFLQALVLSGETQERERILYQFSKRFHYCNPGAFSSAGREGRAEARAGHAGLLGEGPRGSVPQGLLRRSLGVCLGGCGDPEASGGHPTQHGLWKGRSPGSNELSLHSPPSGADSVHTLTCAIMLLNTDLHGQVRGQGA